LAASSVSDSIGVVHYIAKQLLNLRDQRLDLVHYLPQGAAELLPQGGGRQDQRADRHDDRVEAGDEPPDERDGLGKYRQQPCSHGGDQWAEALEVRCEVGQGGVAEPTEEIGEVLRQRDDAASQALHERRERGQEALQDERPILGHAHQLHELLAECRHRVDKRAAGREADERLHQRRADALHDRAQALRLARGGLEERLRRACESGLDGVDQGGDDEVRGELARLAQLPHGGDGYTQLVREQSVGVDAIVGELPRLVSRQLAAALYLPKGDGHSVQGV
jgi:hypothetical protein